MPHDIRGTELAVGDIVLVPCRIKAIHLTEDYCNVDLVTKHTMPPSDTETRLTLNSRQTIKPIATHQYVELQGPASGAPEAATMSASESTGIRNLHALIAEWHATADKQMRAGAPEYQLVRECADELQAALPAAPGRPPGDAK